MALPIGAGAGWLIGRLGNWGRAIVLAALAEGAVAIATMMPVPLSYYSPAIGGLPGAARLGLEPTYYWDALTPAALDWIHRNTRPGEKIVFPSSPTIWNYLRDTGRLRVPGRFWEPGIPRWYVLHNRIGAFEPQDRALVARLGPSHVLVEKQGVPLLYVFPHEELEREKAKLKRQSTPP